MDIDINKMFGNEPSFMSMADHYYNKNFGTMPKSELELLMFTILYEKLESDPELRKKGPISDVSLAFCLGISVQRVDGLIERMTLKRSEDYLAKRPWRQTLSDLIQKKAVTYDESSKSIYIIVNDVLVFYKAIESLKKEDIPYQETTNPRGLILSEAAFAALAYECCEDVTKKNSFKDSVNRYLKEQNIDELLNGQSMGQVLLGIGKEFALGTVKTLLSDKAAEILGKLIDAGEAQVKKGRKKDK